MSICADECMWRPGEDLGVLLCLPYVLEMVSSLNQELDYKSARISHLPVSTLYSHGSQAFAATLGFLHQLRSQLR